MTTYVLAQLTIHDRARYDRYAARFMDVLRHFDGRLLAADESPEVLEGAWPHQKVVLIEFKDREEAARFCPFCGKGLQTPEEVKAKTGDDDA